MADGTVYGYSYDSTGNITRITENGILKLSYQYDGQGQLVRKDNAYANSTYAFTYDANGVQVKKLKSVSIIFIIGIIIACRIQPYEIIN